MALLYLLRRTRGHRGSLPPGPKPLPIFGNLFDLGDKPHRTLTHLAKSYGPIMSLRLGQVTTIIVSSPYAAREVLQKKDNSFSGRVVLDLIRALDHHKASLVWLPADAKWRNLRRICSTQLFLPQSLNFMQATRQKKVRELVAYVKERSLVGEAMDVGRAVLAVVLNSISNTFFSVDMEDIQLESAKSFKELVWSIMELVGKPNVSDFFPGLAALDLQGRKRRMETLLGIFDNIFDDIIEQRMHTKRDTGAPRVTNDLLDSLIECMRVGDGSMPDKHSIKALLEDLFTAGTDTSSNTIEWAMAELLRNPKTIEMTIEMAQAELIQAIGNEREVDESDIQKLPYLRAVVKETLRLHPPAPFLVPHRVESTVELCGYTIPEGTRVLVNVWAIGRDENVWANAEHFMPERFLGKDIDYKGRDFELIPFGAGRRICPGLPLAARMIHLVLASLLLPFNWKLPEGMVPRDIDMEEKFGLTLAKATPLQAIPVLR